MHSSLDPCHRKHMHIAKLTPIEILATINFKYASNQKDEGLENIYPHLWWVFVDWLVAGRQHTTHASGPSSFPTTFASLHHTAPQQRLFLEPPLCSSFVLLSNHYYELENPTKSFTMREIVGYPLLLSWSQDFTRLATPNYPASRKWERIQADSCAVL